MLVVVHQVQRNAKLRLYPSVLLLCVQASSRKQFAIAMALFCKLQTCESRFSLALPLDHVCTLTKLGVVCSSWLGMRLALV